MIYSFFNLNKVDCTTVSPTLPNQGYDPKILITTIIKGWSRRKIDIRNMQNDV